MMMMMTMMMGICDVTWSFLGCYTELNIEFFSLNENVDIVILFLFYEIL